MKRDEDSPATAEADREVATTRRDVVRRRGPGKRPAKEQVAIRLDPEVLEAFRAGGEGWQTRMNDALKDWLKTHPQGQ